MNIKQKTQSSNNVGNEISDSIDEMKYLSYLSEQVEHIEDTLSTYREYVGLCNRRVDRKVSKLNSLILDFIFSQKDNFTLTQSHIDDLDLIAELIMIHYSEKTLWKTVTIYQYHSR